MSDDDLMPVTRGMLRRWALTLHTEPLTVRDAMYAVMRTSEPDARRAQLELDAIEDGQAVWLRLLGQFGPCECSRAEGADCEKVCDLCSELPEGWSCPSWSGSGYGAGATMHDSSPGPEGAEAAQVAPGSDTARQAEQ